MADHGHQIYVVTGGVPGCFGIEQASSNVTIERLNTTRTRIDSCTRPQMLIYVAQAALLLKSRIDKFKPDLLHIFFGFPTGAVLPLSFFQQFTRMSYIISLFGGDVPGVDPSTNLLHTMLLPLTRTLWMNAAAVVPNSQKLAHLAKQTLDIPMPVITNGVDLNMFRPDGRTRGSVVRMLFAGRLREQKGLDVLLKALSLACNQLPPWRLTILGDGPFRETYESLSRELNLETLLDWRGWVALEELPQVYQNHDIFVLPSRYEGMSSVVLQAMASGCAIVSSDVFGADEMVTDGENGYIVEVGNAAMMADRLIAICQPRSLEAMQRSSVKLSAEFSWKNIGGQYEELYSSSLRHS